MLEPEEEKALHKKLNWLHYFGGLAFLFLLIQLLTGIFLLFHYEPSLEGAYKSVQHLTNEVAGGSFVRNLHRWVSFSLFLVLIIHIIRHMIRKDFLISEKRVFWLSGALLIIPLFLQLGVGLILPWEWKSYWIMNMVANNFEAIPLVGPSLKAFLLQSFTLPRYLALHILLFPLICLILVEYHFLMKLRNRGAFRYIARHFLMTLPFLLSLILLAMYVTIPSEDPDILPLPSQGEYIPAPEWWILLILLPFYSYRDWMVPLISIILPAIILFVIAFLPFLLKRKKVEEKGEKNSPPPEGAKGIMFLWSKLWQGGAFTKAGHTVIVTLVAAASFGLLYSSLYTSPEQGCTSCHNLYKESMGMAVPPKLIKKEIIFQEDMAWYDYKAYMPQEAFGNMTAHLYMDKNEWLIKHWFEPLETLETHFHIGGVQER